MKLLRHSTSWKSPLVCLALLGQSGVGVCPKERKSREGQVPAGNEGLLWCSSLGIHHLQSQLRNAQKGESSRAWNAELCPDT